MKITTTSIPEVIIIEPDIFKDSRGYFFESYNYERYSEFGIDDDFIQDNESYSVKNVLRGLHYQLPPFAQSKLVRVIKGRILDVAVDIRKSSPYFGKYVSVELSDENKKQFYIPQGFAHGFVVLSDEVIFAYKCDNTYCKSHERGIIYNDPTINIDWGVDLTNVILSDKDKLNLPLKDAEVFR